MDRIEDCISSGSSQVTIRGTEDGDFVACLVYFVDEDEGKPPFASADGSTMFDALKNLVIKLERREERDRAQELINSARTMVNVLSNFRD